MLLAQSDMKSSWPIVIGTIIYLVTCRAAIATEDTKGEFDPMKRSYPEVYETPTGAPPEWDRLKMGSQIHTFFQADRFEYQLNDDNNKRVWDAQGWVGGDYNKLWLKTEGEGVPGRTWESAEVQALYSRTISPFWDVQLGVRHDFRPDPDRTFGVLGVQGLAPYWFEVDTAFFAGEQGDVRWRGEFEYELLLTQKLVLQPRLEINASFDDVPEHGLGSGLNDTEMGLRLRYEIRREIAPYIGVSWARKYGDTADFAEAEGESTSTVSFVMGIRAWF